MSFQQSLWSENRWWEKLQNFLCFLCCQRSAADRFTVSHHNLMKCNPRKDHNDHHTDVEPSTGWRDINLEQLNLLSQKTEAGKSSELSNFSICREGAEAERRRSRLTSSARHSDSTFRHRQPFALGVSAEMETEGRTGKNGTLWAWHVRH